MRDEGNVMRVVRSSRPRGADTPVRRLRFRPPTLVILRRSRPRSGWLPTKDPCPTGTLTAAEFVDLSVRKNRTPFSPTRAVDKRRTECLSRTSPEINFNEG